MQLAPSTFHDHSWYQLKIKSSLAKEEYYLPVATALVEQGFVKVTCTGDKPRHVNRDNIVMLKSF